jgi:hypothetical protein
VAGLRRFGSRESDMSKASKTDWKRLEKLRDEQIDMSNAPALGDEFVARAELQTVRARRMAAQIDEANPPHAEN